MKSDINKIEANMHAPFGPMLMEFKMPQPYIDMLKHIWVKKYQIKINILREILLV